MFNAVSRNTRQSFMVLATAATIVFATGAAVRGAVVLRGPAARAAVAEALLPFILQYRRIKAIHFVAKISQNFAGDTVAFPRPRFRLAGVYKFWADGDRYRIDWQVLKSNYQPATQQVWSYNGQRYESIIGANSLIGVWHQRMAGFMGPGEFNPILSPIEGFCWRATKRQPGNWLDWRRVQTQPREVDVIPRSILIRSYRQSGQTAEFLYDNRGGRWPAVWRKKSPPPPGFRPGRRRWCIVDLAKRGAMWLPVYVHDEQPAAGFGGQKVGTYYSYRTFNVLGRPICLLRAETVISEKRKFIAIATRKVHVNGRLNPAVFTINYDRAVGIWEHHRIVSFTHLPPAPARTQHLGKTR